MREHEAREQHGSWVGPARPAPPPVGSFRESRMQAPSPLRNDIDLAAVLLSSASAALRSGRYNQLNGLIDGALERLAAAGRSARELEEELVRARAVAVPSVES